MITKTKLGQQEGYLCQKDGKGFFISHSKGQMKNGARFDKISVSAVYDQSGQVRFARKKLGSQDVNKGNTYAVAAIDTSFISELIQALTMLAMDLGAGQQYATPETVDEPKEKNEVQEWLDDHGGKFSA